MSGQLLADITVSPTVEPHIMVKALKRRRGWNDGDGDGEGEGGIIFIVAAAVDGRIGCERVEAVGESGDSRRSGGGLETTVAAEDCMASKAWTLALTAEEAMRAEREGEDAGRGARKQQRSRADNARPVACESGEQARRAHDARQTPGPVAHVPEAPWGT